MVFRIGWISMASGYSHEFGEKPASITQSEPRRQTRRAPHFGKSDQHRTLAGGNERARERRLQTSST